MERQITLKWNLLYSTEMTLGESVRIVLMPRSSWSWFFAALAVYNTLVPSFLLLSCQVSYGTLTGFSWKMAIDKVEQSCFHDSSSIAGSIQQRAVPSWDPSLSSEHPQCLCPKKIILWAFLEVRRASFPYSLLGHGAQGSWVSQELGGRWDLRAGCFVPVSRL